MCVRVYVCVCACVFKMVPWVGLRCAIVVFPDHTHLLFYEKGAMVWYAVYDCGISSSNYLIILNI